MDFLTSRLQTITGHQLHVTWILEFLSGLSVDSPHLSQIRIEEFEKKWNSELYAKQLILAYIQGSWKPTSVATSQEIRVQKSWETYVDQVYKLSFTVSSISTLINPLTFREMIQHEFWKDMYDTFGQKVTAFILDKALIIFEVENNLYVLMAGESCILHRKISNAKHHVRKDAAPHFNPTNPTNPYKLADHDKNEIQVIAQPGNPRPQCRKRRRDYCQHDQELTHQFQKKVKISTCIISSETKSLTYEGSGIIRWFKPTQQILNFLIEAREKLKRTSTIPAPQSRPEDKMVQLNFVGIMDNKEFSKIARINIVHKQYRPLDFNLPIRTPEWKGLVIKEPDIRSPDRKYNVNVYRISEDFARKNNIRVKVKSRRGNKKQQKEVSVNSTETNFSKDNRPNSSANAASVASNVIGSHFNPLMLLSTLPALYNKSSWSHWPKTHIITTVCSRPLEDAIPLLLEDILKTNVDRPTYDINIENANEWLHDILKKIIAFHKRVKDIHKLVKRCVLFWMLKHEKKILSKENKAVQRKEWKLLSTGKSINDARKSIETIDITGDKFSEVFVGPQPITETTILTASSGTEYHNSSEIQMRNEIISDATISGAPESKKVIVYPKLKEKIPHGCVLMTLKHIFYLSGLEDLMGSKKNSRSFYRFLRKSLILAGTKSSLQLGQLMSQLDPTACNWMPTDITLALKNSLFAKIAKWAFTNYVMIILKTSFYITETNASRLHSCFYLRESWKSISESVRHRLLKSGTLNHMGLVPTRAAHRRRSLQGINSRIRFLPKRNNGMRPIISLKREARNRWDESNAKFVIDYIVRRTTPHRIRDINVLRQRWLKFLEEWHSANKPKLYFVRGDIQDAYPSVNVSKLKAVLEEVGKELGTLSQKEFKVFSKSRITTRKVVISWKDPKLWTSSICARPCLVQNNGGQNIRLKPEEVFRKLFPYSNHNVLRIGKHKYNLERGLPQGWILSEGYCNLYYGAMDLEHLFRFINNKGEFFNTSVDDYIYITPNPKLAARFLDKMEIGFKSYNCKFNSSKIFTNIFPRVGWPLSIQECEWVTFCGWCFCLTCGHIMRDFSGYAGQDMASTLSFIPTSATSPENFLVARMKMMLPARLHPFMLDPLINCRARITLNIWEAGLIFGFRFYAICRVIFPNLSAFKDPERAKRSIGAIIGCANAVSRIILGTFNITYTSGGSHAQCSRDGLCPCIYSYHGVDSANERGQCAAQQPNILKEPLQKSEILYIVFHAFELKLSQHASVFGKEILPRLNKIKQCQRSLLNQDCRSFVDEVLPNQLPLHFKNVKV